LPADASAVPTVRGLHSWGAVLVAVVFTGIGVVVELNGTSAQSVGWPLRILFVAGVVLAALAVRRGAIFTAMVQPPLVLAAAIVVGGLLDGSGGGLLNTGLDVVRAFPLMVVGTAAAVVIGVIRMVAQPLHRRSAAGTAQTSAHA
jgi:hypothetical protein